MKSLYTFLFPTKPNDTGISLLLLAVRIIFGLLLLSHGMQKWTNFTQLATQFPDPLGVGSEISLGLAIFAEVFCSLGFIFGVLYRLALIPMIFTMCMAFFVVLGKESFQAKELPFAYLVVFVIMFIAGAGKYSIDRYLAKMV